MIGHKAVAQYAQVVPFTLGFESFEIEVPVGVGSKNRLTIVASLRDVVGRSDDNETLFAGHNVVSVLLHSNPRKLLLYKGLLSLTPVPDLPVPDLPLSPISPDLPTALALAEDRCAQTVDGQPERGGIGKR